MSERTRFVGLDAHAATIAVAVADEDGSVTEHGAILNDPPAVRKLLNGLAAPGARLRVAYEAGPTGYALHRQLAGLGVECLVVAPSLIPRRPGDRVKTDARDAVTLARLLRSGDLTAVWVPDQAHEALRNLVRARADAKADELRARHRLSKFLLRQGIRPPAPVRAWSAKYATWLHQVSFAEPADQVVFDDYCATARAATERVRRLETALMLQATSSPQVRAIAALQSFHGIGFLSAVTIVAEVGDLRRFATAPQLMAYAGLVPSEHSSGGSRHRGQITKTGNGHLRHVLGEAAHHARHVPSARSAAKQRRDGVPEPIVRLAGRCHERLHRRYRHLSGRIGRPKALTAVARELAGFIWALGQLLDDVTLQEATSAMTNGWAPVAVEVGSVSENPRQVLCDREPARLVRGSSVTDHCHAAPALPTREYQGDHRRHIPCSRSRPVPAPFGTPLDNSFHIRTAQMSRRIEGW